jgi:hypothetical protein
MTNSLKLFRFSFVKLLVTKPKESIVSPIFSRLSTYVVPAILWAGGEALSWATGKSFDELWDSYVPENKAEASTSPNDSEPIPSVPKSNSSPLEANLYGIKTSLPGVHGLENGIITFNTTTKTEWTSITKQHVIVPNQSNLLIVQVEKGHVPEIAIEFKHGKKLTPHTRTTSRYEGFGQENNGKFVYNLDQLNNDASSDHPLSLHSKKMDQFQIIFAPGTIPAGSQIKIFFF